MSRGFTLLELLLSVAAIGIIAGLSIPFFYGFQTSHDLDIAAQSVAMSLRRAQVLSQGMDGDSPWGVRVATTSVTLFRGSSFAARNALFDESFSRPETIAASGTVEFVFERFNGLPVSTGTTTLTAQSGQRRDIAVNARGMVSY